MDEHLQKVTILHGPSIQFGNESNIITQQENEAYKSLVRLLTHSQAVLSLGPRPIYVLDERSGNETRLSYTQTKHFEQRQAGRGLGTRLCQT